jgi:hypothetical protein
MPQFEGGGSRTSYSKPIAKPKSKVSGHPTQRRKPVSSAAKRRVSSGSSGSSRSYSSGGRSGPRIVSSSSGRMSRPSGVGGGGSGAMPRSVKPASLSDYLRTDSVYRSQQAQFNKTLADFMGETGLNRTKIGNDFNTANKALGDQKVVDLESILEDFASRGMQRSGEYGTAVGDYEKEFGTRLTELQKRRTDQLNDLTRQETAFKREQQLQSENAKQQAIQRRAAKYGL